LTLPISDKFYKLSEVAFTCLKSTTAGRPPRKT
jgi:hypothetical protein